MYDQTDQNPDDQMLFEMTGEKCPFLDFTGQALLSSHSLIKYHSLNFSKKKTRQKTQLK